MNQPRNKLVQHAAERIQGYSDAVLSIIATILVIPLNDIAEEAETKILGFLNPETLFEVLTSAYFIESVLLYFASFAVVFIVWTWHGRQFRNIHQISTVLVFINLIELLCTSLLPFSAGLAAHVNSVSGVTHDERKMLQFPFYINVLVIAVSNLTFQTVLAITQRKFKSLTLFEAIVDTMIAVLATMVASFKPRYAFLILLGIPLTAGLVQYLGNRNILSTILNEHEIGLLDEQSQLLQGSHYSKSYDKTLINQSRLEVFVDGVIAIAGTLLVLEIRPPHPCKEISGQLKCWQHSQDSCAWEYDVATRKHMCNYKVENDLNKYKLLAVAYLVSFVLINVLWSQHHFIFDRFKQMTTAFALGMNYSFCIWLSLLPMAFKLVTKYSLLPQLDDTKLIGTQHVNGTQLLKGAAFNKLDKGAGRTAGIFGCFVLFLASSTLLVMLLYAELVNKSSSPNVQQEEEEENRNEEEEKFVVSSEDWLQFLLIPVIALLNIVLLWISKDVSIYPICTVPFILFGWNAYQLFTKQ